MQRMCVVGTSGVGKTTLARQNSQCLAIPPLLFPQIKYTSREIVHLRSPASAQKW